RITTRHVPPARTSSSAWGTVHGFGQNHCFSSSGCVQAAYNRSRGASIRRVSTSSCSVDSGVSLLLIVSLRSIGVVTGYDITQKLAQRSRVYIISTKSSAIEGQEACRMIRQPGSVHAQE